ncbi:uncharacterized protein LOC126800003 [Argentina anserina]|uniref:uncharacterized protein LOC126800003 n=1 Tax=Argentina anserina TaxID=57926 RepID=UPI0021765569|nr:uncharacterized protein LOC126800003 [Potentilla anserina]
MDQLQHFSHDHPLMFKEEEQKNKDGAALVCSACGKPVHGPSYSCNQCSESYILHKSCAELPREIQYPIHPKHPLVLLPDQNYRCDDCREFRSHVFSYRCEQCDYGIDLQCAHSDPSNKTWLEHFSHEHTLILITRSGGLPVVCQGCQAKVDTAYSPERLYRCSRILCRYYLHKSCAEMPPEFHHPMHTKHPLILNRDEAKHHLCEACNQDCSGKFTYSCSQCFFNLDPKCTINWTDFKHFSHIHPLKLKEAEQKCEDGAVAAAGPPVACSACGDPVVDPSYSCNQCPQFILHKSCAELPRELHHPIHNKHPLVLLPDRNYRCDICRKSHSGKFSYKCKPCDFDVDLQCASVINNIKYLQHFSHEHALIFVEDPENREGNSPVGCKGCGERVLGPSYCCSRFLCHYTLHNSCVELPLEFHHPMHTKHPLILNSGRAKHLCDACNQDCSDKFTYSCSQCFFNLDPKCTFNWTDFKHFSHIHPLKLKEAEQKYEDGAAAVAGPPVVCSACGDLLLGPSYSCNHCPEFILHKPCAELPRELHHPIHKKHPLVLLPDRYYSCDICRKAHSGKFSYKCEPCDFDVDLQCAPVISNIKYLQHFSHEHALIFVEDPEKREGKSLVVCKGCGERVLGPSYCCSRFLCHYTLHKSCVELPNEMHHPIHRKHPLMLLSGRYYRCDICRRSHSNLFSYRCEDCDFDLDLQCASNLSNIKCLEHFSHEHELIFMEEPKRKDEGSPVVCDGCLEQVFGPSYCCSRYRCYYTLHESCTKLPSEFRHSMHTQHPLILHKDSGRGNRCDACNQDCSGKFTYSCFQCDFKLDKNCTMNWTGFKHFSHEHPLLLEREPKERCTGPLFCDGCQDPILGPTYTCINTFRRRRCGFNLHQKCAELPHKIEHPMHNKHPLFLLNILPDIKVRRICNVCNEPCRFLYSCSNCDFNLDLKCASNWQNIIANDSHEHQFTVLRKKMSDLRVNCDVCGEFWTGTVYYMCSICQLLVHKECASLPHDIKKPDHQHQLKLTWFLENMYPNNLSCKVCSISIDKCRAAYCCGECSSYVAHVACTTADYSREESFWDIALNDDESDNAPEIKHFSHQHLLADNDPCKEVKDEHKSITCEGCIRPITATKESFYCCTEQEELCSFFLHKVCAQLPKKILLPLLHQHQFTLLSRAPYIGGVFTCYMCGTLNQGFTYTCEECALSKGETVFYLDLQCVAYWDNKALKHDSHLHRLFLDTEWDKDARCNSCGCNIYFCFSCKRCEFHLCIPCVRLPLTGRHRYDDHPLKLTYASVECNLGYYCQICEGTRDPKQWFYRCDNCDFDCHTHCILGRFPRVKLGSTCKHDDHGQHLVTLVDKARSPIRFDKRENILPCEKCRQPCIGLVFECGECNINLHREGYCQLTELESSAN